MVTTTRCLAAKSPPTPAAILLASEDSLVQTVAAAEDPALLLKGEAVPWEAISSPSTVTEAAPVATVLEATTELRNGRTKVTTLDSVDLCPRTVADTPRVKEAPDPAGTLSRTHESETQVDDTATEERASEMRRRELESACDAKLAPCTETETEPVVGALL